jgi:Glyoxalase-like domain
VVNERLDHVVLVCGDLERGTAVLAARLGVRPLYGGVHATGLTHNALVGLDGRRYLELLAPTGAPSGSDDEWIRRAHGATEPTVLTYCVRSPRPLSDLAALGRARGWTETDVSSNGRQTPEGVRLRWRVLTPRVDGFGFSFPFFIDWLDSVHPSDALRSTGRGCSLQLVEFAVGHPEAELLAASLRVVGVEIETFRADGAAFRLSVQGPSGVVAL